VTPTFINTCIYLFRTCPINFSEKKNNNSTSVSYTRGSYPTDKDHVGNLQNPERPVTSEISLVTRSHLLQDSTPVLGQRQSPTNKPQDATRVKAGSDRTSAFKCPNPILPFYSLDNVALRPKLHQMSTFQVKHFD
jgi:hypothetical protein